MCGGRGSEKEGGAQSRKLLLQKGPPCNGWRRLKDKSIGCAVHQHFQLVHGVTPPLALHCLLLSVPLSGLQQPGINAYL